MKMVLGKHGAIGIEGFTGPVERMPAYVEKFYVRTARSWVVALRDVEGNQIGDAVYVYSKPEAQREVDALCQEHNVKEQRQR